jgi:hypothetical protein
MKDLGTGSGDGTRLLDKLEFLGHLETSVGRCLFEPNEETPPFRQWGAKKISPLSY